MDADLHDPVSSRYNTLVHLSLLSFPANMQDVMMFRGRGDDCRCCDRNVPLPAAGVQQITSAPVHLSYLLDTMATLDPRYFIPKSSQ